MCYGAFTLIETKTNKIGAVVESGLVSGWYEHLYTIMYKPFFTGSECEHTVAVITVLFVKLIFGHPNYLHLCCFSDRRAEGFADGPGARSTRL